MNQHQALHCPVCGEAHLLPLYACTTMPLTGRLPRRPDVTVPHHDLHLDYCPVCSFFCQRSGIDAAIDYVDVARSTARQLPAYVLSLAERLVAHNHDGLLIEVGSNDGAFMDALREAGFSRMLGIEPSRHLAEMARANGHAIESAPLDLALAAQILAQHGQARTVVCRHTLEHVPDFSVFLRAIRSLLADDGIACIEVPSALPIIESLHIQEIWDEHVNYFLPGNLRLALEQAGFEVLSIDVEPFREMQNLLAWVRPAQAGAVKPVHDAQMHSLCESFESRLQPVLDALRQRVASSPTPRVVLGASHPQANFLNISGLASFVSVAVDDDPLKAGRWLPLKGGSIPIHASTELRHLLADGTLLLSAFGYPQWMEKARLQAEGAARVLDISELLFVKSERNKDAA